MNKNLLRLFVSACVLFFSNMAAAQERALTEGEWHHNQTREFVVSERSQDCLASSACRRLGFSVEIERDACVCGFQKTITRNRSTLKQDDLESISLDCESEFHEYHATGCLQGVIEDRIITAALQGAKKAKECLHKR